ncbi:MAG: hypothetical protein H6Q25_1324 [Bacteroidetes bacterium]|nr:hypothetical protein [Bacteroidota bacterium]
MNNFKLSIPIFVEHRTFNFERLTSNVELLPSPVPRHQSMIIEHMSIRAFQTFVFIYKNNLESGLKRKNFKFDIYQKSILFWDAFYVSSII